MLEHFDNSVLDANFLYGMTSNRGNDQNRTSMSFLLACYESGDLSNDILSSYQMLGTLAEWEKGYSIHSYTPRRPS